MLVLSKLENEYGNLLEVSNDIWVDHFWKIWRKGLTKATATNIYYILVAYYKWAIKSNRIKNYPIEGIKLEIDRLYVMG